MPHIQIKNVPAALHRRIAAQAKKEGRTVRDYVLDAVRTMVDNEEFYAQISKRKPVRLGRPAARAVEEARAEREDEVG